MASNPPFELEDQTDEDFFDKLVNDDDDIVGGGLKSTGLMETHDASDGDKSDEVKAFANLGISEVGIVNDVSKATWATGDDYNIEEVHNVLDGDESNEANAFVDLSTSESANVNDVSEPTWVTGGVDNARVESVEVKEPVVRDGEAIHSLMSSNLFSFDNGSVPENSVLTSKAQVALTSESTGSVAGGIKEIQWSSFSDSGEHGVVGFGSYSDFFNDLGAGGMENITSRNEAVEDATTGSSNGHAKYQGENGSVAGQSVNGADLYSTQYWENLYPGWKYDSNTGQWYQLDGSDGTADRQEYFASALGNVRGSFDVGGDSQWAISDVQTSHASYAQQTAQSASLLGTTDVVTGWNHISQQSGEYQYPAHMVFDPQYPGWYYDTIAQEWRSLEAYHLSAESVNHNQQAQNGYLSAASYYHSNINSGALQGLSSGSLNQSWAKSFGDCSEQGANARQSDVLTESRSTVGSSVSHPWQNSYDSVVYSKSPVDEQKLLDSREMVSYDTSNQSSDSSTWVGGSCSFVPSNNNFKQFNCTPQAEQSGPVQYPNAYYGSQNVASISQPLFSNVAYVPGEGRSSVGRPPHALVAFGFGGKLVVMKHNSPSGFSSLDSDGHLISVMNLIEVASLNNNLPGTGVGTGCYVRSLSHPTFPGPLVGGNAGSKELNRWIDERIANCKSLDMDYGKGGALKLLLSLLKVACQNYGKLRSFGMDTGVMENNIPESAVAKLCASSKRDGGQFSECSAIAKSFMNLPSEAQLQATATEVQKLLISGRKQEALQCAQEGQFWGFALILARELGDQFYADTVKQMALTQLLVGSPLRTFCLLIARKPEEVFSTNIIAPGNMRGPVLMSSQSAQNAGYGILDNWEENLAVIAANRTENDHLVIIHLGDCLWKEKNDVTAAHICYLVAEADFELYSDSARLCLIGADHLTFPRTYASPEAIQRTELFEYSKVLGNSQFVLLPLLPYKLIYAHMLAEVGRLSDSLKYCQVVHKSLKTRRSPEVETLKQLLVSLEERIRTHQQSGYAANLAPAKIVGKLLNLLDSTAYRVVGGVPAPVPATTQGGIQVNEHFQTSLPKVSSCQSTMAMSLMPSASMEPISQWAVDGSRMIQNRSISEPDIGRIPKPVQKISANEASSSSSEGKQSGTTGTSRFGRLNFGAQILQKTVGLVLKPRQGHQAKLGDTNKFYYDEKLKRWVEEGAEPPAEETSLPPPPTAAFQNRTSDYNLQNALNDGLHAADHSSGSMSSIPPGSSSGIPAIPPSSNQFSARGLMGVRSRYVDTFNKGSSMCTNLFQTPSVPSTKPATVAGAKLFIPTAASSDERTLGSESAIQDKIPKSEENSSVPMNNPNQKLEPFTVGTMQSFFSVDNIPSSKTMRIDNSALASQSRRTVSWHEIHRDRYAAPSMSEMKASALPFMATDSLPASQPANGSNFGDDLQEVEL